jgi:outer membrane protein assembly factor BamB
MKGNRLKTLAAGLALLAVAGNAAPADWPQWRGPSRTGVAAEAITDRWPAGSLLRGWSVEVGEGHAGPVVSGGRVYVHARVGGDEVISALDLADGRRLWSHTQPVAYTPTAAAAGHGRGPKGTPLLHRGRLYAFGATGTLTCLETASGRLVWRREFPQGYPLYGAAQSPAADGDLVIVHAGGGSGALMAFDAATGADRWKSSAPGGAAYASPMIATIGGTRQVVTLTETHVVGVALADGAPLWSVPFTTMYEQNAVTPVVYGDLVIVSGIEKGVLALRIQREGPRWDARKAWETADASFYMSSPVLAGTRLLGFSHRQKGQLVALDAATGRLLFAGPARQGESASLVLAGEDLLVLTTEAELVVVKAGAARFTPVATYGVGESATWAHLAVAPRALLVKDARALTLWRVP